MKGVILGINPQATIVDICHEIEPQSILQAAFLLGTSCPFFPKDTVHVAVVDPGVGTARRAILLITPQGYFLAPDNGVLSYVVQAGFPRRRPGRAARRIRLPAGYRAFSLTNPRYWLHPVSSTFHGRDIFAPVAAHLSLGVAPQELGEEVTNLAWLPLTEPRWSKGVLEGVVLHIDRFGNLITDIPGRLVAGRRIEVEVNGWRIQGLSPSYAAGQEILALIGSHNNLEVSIRSGSAAGITGATVGSTVLVRRE